MIKLIIFDWDDVFTLGSKEGYFACYHETLEELDVILDKQEERRRILSNWGTACPVVVKALLKEHPELITKGQKIFNKKFLGETFVNHLSIISGTIPLLNRLAKKYRLCIATGVHPELLKNKIMAKFDIPRVFSQIISSYDIIDVKKQKPNPFIAEQILKTQKMKPCEAVLVGDAKSDVVMARGAGLIPIAVLSGHLSKKEAEELDVKYIIKDVTHLEKVLTKLNNPQDQSC